MICPFCGEGLTLDEWQFEGCPHCDRTYPSHLGIANEGNYVRRFEVADDENEKRRNLVDALKQIVISKGRRSPKLAYMIHVDDLRESLAALKADGFVLARGRSVWGKRASFYEIKSKVPIATTTYEVLLARLYVDTQRAMPRGKIIVVQDPLGSLNNL